VGHIEWLSDRILLVPGVVIRVKGTKGGPIGWLLKRLDELGLKYAMSLTEEGTLIHIEIRKPSGGWKEQVTRQIERSASWAFKRASE